MRRCPSFGRRLVVHFRGGAPPMDTLFHLAHADLLKADWPLWANALVLLWALLLGHALGDFPLQGEFLAVGKDRHADLSRVTGGKLWPKGMWLYCLTIHSLIQAAFVWVVTGSVVLSLVEFVLHWVIDLVKNEGWTTFYQDQALHVVCKVLYVALFAAGTRFP